MVTRRYGPVSVVQCALDGDVCWQPGGRSALHERLHMLAQIAPARPHGDVSIRHDFDMTPAPVRLHGSVSIRHDFDTTLGLA